MAAITTAVIAGAGALMSFHGQQQAAKAGKNAAKLNAKESELQAEQARQQAKEDEQAFRLSFRRDQGRNRVAIGASGVKMEGSPLEVLQDNAAMAEQDAINIRRGGERQRSTFLRQASAFRQSGRATARAGRTQGAASLLSGAADTFITGKKSGAFD